VPGLETAWEPLGPASRNTGLIISEIMYHPKHSNDLEFIEIFNAGLIEENLSGCRISGDVDYVFPPNTRLPAGGFLVVARNPALLEQAYGISGVYGPWIGAETNALPDSRGTVRLRYRHLNAVMLEVIYEGAAPWPLAADGSGHSLVLARPSFGQGNPEAWAASDKIGGSPGRMENFNLDPLRNVVINEFLANSPLPQEDYIELYNHGNQSVDLFGAYLSDDRDTNKFRINTHVILPPRGFQSFTQSELGFALSAGGERIYLVNSNQTRVIDLVAFDGQAPGVASGRYPDGAPGTHELTAQTPGSPNARLLIRDVVINEIMFNPITGDDDDQYVELYNRGTNTVNLSGWQFRDGIDFVFPNGTLLPPNSYLVIGRDVTRLLSKYPQLNTTNLVGDFSGRLSHGGERIALYMPEYVVSTNDLGNLVTNINWMVADEVTYVDAGRWARWADGGGSSLELIDPNSDNRLAPNWADSDETGKSSWTNIVHSAVLDHVYMRDAAGALMNEVQVMLLGAGEALMDDVLVQQGGPGTLNPNLVINPGFETGLGSWLIQGNHERSGLEPAGPNNPSQCLHIRATAGGDNGANRVECDLSTALNPNTVATIGARFRWLRGFPIVLMRLHGGGIEAVGTLPAPPNLGSPGLPNSRLMPNAGPAVYAVTHSPVLPAANQAVVVAARVVDPDGVGTVTLRYRFDPGATLTSVSMKDDGTGGDLIAGDGVYSATIPGQGAGVLIAFHLSATDGRATPASTLFPADAPVHECLVRFGDPEVFGNLGVYRIWMTQSNYNRWRDRERLSNEPQDCTFVYGRTRAIYNAGARYRGSPFTRNPSSPLATGANFVWTLPDDDLFLGADELNIDSLEPTGRDATALRELTSFTMADQLGLPFSYQRFIRPVINGTLTPSPVSTDSQQPNGDYTAMWFPEVEDGELFKVDDWFEFADTLTGSAGTGMQGNKSASLDAFETTLPNGRVGLKKDRYRWNWEKKFNRGLNDNYDSLFAAVRALTEPNTSLYPAQVDAILETEEWLTALAFRHVVGDWDGYGYNRGKNQFIYRPAGGKFYMLLWDLDFAIGCNGGHGPSQDLFSVAQDGLAGQNHMPEVARMYNHPYFRRIYMQALLRIADTVLTDAAYMPILDARYRALLANGVTGLTSPYVGSGAQGISLPAWIQQRRTYIYQQMASASNLAFAVTSPTTVTSSSNSITITGNAPLWVRSIRVNDVDYRFNWSSVTAWSVLVPIRPGLNQLVVQPYGNQGEPLPGSVTVEATFSAADTDPRGVVVFNEIMHQPAVPDAEYVELFNTSFTNTFDLSGWRINGLSYTFPANSYMPPRSFLVLARDPHIYLATYGAGSAVFGQYAGNLQSGGETLTLIKPGATPELDLVVDKVRYEGQLPWNTNALATGSSLQLVDAAQDNARPGNWTSRFDPARYTDPVYFPGYTNYGWRFVQTNANMVTVRAVTQPAVTNVVGGVTNITPAVTNDVGRLLIYLGAGSGEVYLDDLRLVVGINVNEGPNLIRNGNFESPLLEVPPVVNSFFVSTNMTNSSISTDLKIEGNSSLRLVQSRTASQTNFMIMQHIFPAPTNGTLCSLSFWYYVNTNTPPTNTLVVRLQNSSLNGTTNYGPVVTPPSYTPPQLISMATNYLSPARANPVAAVLPNIPPVWLNEVLPINTAGIQDLAGHRAPWIELYNAGTNAVSLEGLYLSDSYTNLTRWPFPPGSVLNPGEFKIIFADGAPGETTSNEWHTSFALSSGSGSIALSRIYNGEPQVLDYLNFEGLQDDWSYGSYPNGQPFDRLIFTVPTPGAPNELSPAPVRINEWLASNINPGGYPDPVDGQYDDWFELYNAGPNAANIGGYYLTDDPANPTAWRIPEGTVIPPYGFLLVWADGQTGQNGQSTFGDLHASFRLSRDGDYIGLFAPMDTNLVEIDSVTFGYQESNVSEGRYPDGAANKQRLTSLTPRASNVAGNTAPVIAPIPDITVPPGQVVAFTVVAADAQVPPQSLAYSIVANPGGIPTPPGAIINPATGWFEWTAPGAFLPSTNTFTVQVEDDGTPGLAAQATFRVLVVLPPTTAITPPSGNGDLTISFGAFPGKHYRVEFKSDLSAPSWTVLVDNVLATGPTLVFTDNIANGPQRFYRVVQLD